MAIGSIEAGSKLAQLLKEKVDSDGPWTISRAKLAGYDQFPGDPDRGIPAGAEAFEYFEIKDDASGKFLTGPHGGGGEATLEEPGAEDHWRWWMLVFTDGQYKLATMCKDSITSRFLSEGGWTGQESATSWAVSTEYKTSEPALAVLKMLTRAKKEQGSTEAEAPFSITAEELVAQFIIVLKARASELGHPLSDEDAAVVGKFMGEASCDLPTSQAEIDMKLGQIKEMPNEALEQTIEMMKMMAVEEAGT